MLPQLCATNKESCGQWRLRRDVASQLGRMTKAAAKEQVIEVLWPTAMTLCGDPVSVVRNTAAAQIGILLSVLQPQIADDDVTPDSDIVGDDSSKISTSDDSSDDTSAGSQRHDSVTEALPATSRGGCGTVASAVAVNGTCNGSMSHSHQADQRSPFHGHATADDSSGSDSGTESGSEDESSNGHQPIPVHTTTVLRFGDRQVVHQGTPHPDYSLASFDDEDIPNSCGSSSNGILSALCTPFHSQHEATATHSQYDNSNGHYVTTHANSSNSSSHSQGSNLHVQQPQLPPVPPTHAHHVPIPGKKRVSIHTPSTAVQLSPANSPRSMPMHPAMVPVGYLSTQLAAQQKRSASTGDLAAAARQSEIKRRSSSSRLTRASSARPSVEAFPQRPGQYIDCLVSRFGKSSTYQDRQLFVLICISVLTHVGDCMPQDQQQRLLQQLVKLTQDDVPSVRQTVSSLYCALVSSREQLTKDSNESPSSSTGCSEDGNQSSAQPDDNGDQIDRVQNGASDVTVAASSTSRDQDVFQSCIQQLQNIQKCQQLHSLITALEVTGVSCTSSFTAKCRGNSDSKD